MARAQIIPGTYCSATMYSEHASFFLASVVVRAIQIRQRAEKGEARRAEDKEIKAYFQHRGSEVSQPVSQSERAAYIRRGIKSARASPQKTRCALCKGGGELYQGRHSGLQHVSWCTICVRTYMPCTEVPCIHTHGSSHVHPPRLHLYTR